jgi:hypothetical protein
MLRPPGNAPPLMPNRVGGIVPDPGRQNQQVFEVPGPHTRSLGLFGLSLPLTEVAFSGIRPSFPFTPTGFGHIIE